MRRWVAARATWSWNFRYERTFSWEASSAVREVVENAWEDWRDCRRRESGRIWRDIVAVVGRDGW